MLNPKEPLRVVFADGSFHDVELLIETNEHSLVVRVPDSYTAVFCQQTGIYEGSNVEHDEFIKKATLENYVENPITLEISAHELVYLYLLVGNTFASYKAGQNVQGLFRRLKNLLGSAEPEYVDNEKALETSPRFADAAEEIINQCAEKYNAENS